MVSFEKYEKWLNNENTDLKLKEELKTMDQKAVNDAFYTNIEFGTAGMRGLLGAGTNRINIHTIRKANTGFAKYIADHNGKDKGVAIGYDNRHMSREFAFDSARLMAMHNIKSYVFESLRPTPELSFAVRYFNCFGGIMITASHNPKEYNGYKLYDEKGCQLIPKLANEVIANVNAVEDELGIKIELTDEQEKLITVIGKEVDEEYYRHVLDIQYEKEMDKSNIKVVFSPEHGTAYIPVNEVLKRAGYKVINVEEQCSPDPDFSNTLSPNPEELKAYEKAMEYAEKNNADLILVCDPDADRMGVGVLHNGEYIILSGNQSGAVLIEYIFNRMKAHDLMPENPVMFNTVVTGDLGEKVAGKYNVATEKTLTGFKFIGEKVAEYEISKAKEYVFGYEESYGSLIKPFVRDKDAPQACLMLAEACSFYKHQGKTLVDVLNNLYEELGYYVETQTSITLTGEQGALKIKAIINNLRNNRIYDIAGFKVVKWEDYGTFERWENNTLNRLEGFTQSDVLKYFLEDGSWIAIRPSGTEPKCKIYYCIKGSDKHETDAKVQQYIKAMKALTA